MLSLVAAAGWPIWFLIAASVFATTLIIERARSLRNNQVLSDTALAAAQKAGVNVEPNILASIAAQGQSGRLLSAGLSAAANGKAAAESAMQDEAQYIQADLSRYLGALGTIAAVAPLLGLFGTVIGMIETFGAQTPSGMNPAQLAQGISIALYNTAAGIFVAIVALLAHRYFRAKVDAQMLALLRQAQAFANSLK